MKTVALIDFDGTLTLQDTGHVILNHFAGNRWVPINNAWQRFEISTEERARIQFGMVHTTPQELAALVVNQVQIDPDFAVFETKAIKQGWRIHIISDGYDFYIRHILAANGLSELEFTANYMRFSNGRINLKHQHQHPHCQMCGNCKLSVALEYRRAGYRLVVIGDGYSDRGGAQIADLVYAKNHLAHFCRQRGLAFQTFAGFSDITADLETKKWQIADQQRPWIETCPSSDGGSG